MIRVRELQFYKILYRKISVRYVITAKVGRLVILSSLISNIFRYIFFFNNAKSGKFLAIN